MIFHVLEGVGTISGLFRKGVSKTINYKYLHCNYLSMSVSYHLVLISARVNSETHLADFI